MQLTIQQVAEHLGITPRQVRYRIASGQIPANKVGGRWRIESNSLARSPGQADARQRKRANLRTAVEDALDVPPSDRRKRYSLRDLRAFQIGVPLYHKAIELLGAEHIGTRSLYSTLELLARGCHRYRRDHKAAAYDAARDEASNAACALMVVAKPVARVLLDGIEQDLMAAIAGLMRHMERQRQPANDARKARSQR